MSINKEQIKEILDLVNLCPENLREKCFELLLLSALDQQAGAKGKGRNNLPNADEGQNQAGSAQEEKIDSGEEIVLKDLHTKAKKIIPKEITLEEVNGLFYKEGGELLPLFDDLKSDKVAESQIRVALMEAFKNGLSTGNFEFDIDIVREKCVNYKCYDSTNFAANFKKNHDYFTEEYIKKGKMSLSSKGKQRMIQVAKELAV